MGQGTFERTSMARGCIEIAFTTIDNDTPQGHIGKMSCPLLQRLG